MQLATSTLPIVVLTIVCALTACTSKPAATRNTESKTAAQASPAVSPAAATDSVVPPAASGASLTNVYMHNVMLTENAGLMLRVRWLRGRMLPAHPGKIASFDEPSSFILDIEAGVVGISFADLNHALNGGMMKDSPLKNVTVSPVSRQEIKITGTLHKGLPLPVEIAGQLGAAPDGRVLLHVKKLHVLKMPLKGFLDAFHVKTGDLVDPKGAQGVEVSGDDIYFDPEQILPPPRKRGKLTDVHVSRLGDIVETYGAARPEVREVKQWRNFIDLQGGVLEFGRLRMQHVDLMMIDISNDEWFHFDLPHYQEQLVYGYTRMTPQAGLRIFMPDVERLPRNPATRNISLQWLKNRNVPPPAGMLQVEK
jgi:hypothetical protein